MKRILILLTFIPFLAISQGTIPYNTHVATTSGNWNDCNTWNNPIRIYSSREKTINNGVMVNQNSPFVASNKINFTGNGKILLNGKISFKDSIPINCNQASNFNIVDNIIVDFATTPSPPVKSQTGFLGGLGGNGTWRQDSINKLPTRTSISELKPRMFRQGKRFYYQESFDLTKSSPTTNGRVHMIVADEWISKIEYEPDNPYYPHIKYTGADSDKFVIKPNDSFPRYDTYLDNYFNWGYNNGNPLPGIVWECWNEPDGTSLEPNSVIPRPVCYPDCAGEESIDYWPIQARQNFYEIYKHFHQRLIASSLPSTAQIAGPSIGYFNKAYLKEFFDYCLANNLKVNVVTWHEINYPSKTKPYTLLKEHVDWVRKNFKDNIAYAALNIQSIEINETIHPIDRNNPAGILASLGALETAGVDYACKSCWEVWINGLLPIYVPDGNDSDTKPDIINGAVSGRGSCNDNSLNDLYTVTYTQNSDGSFLKDTSGIPKPNDNINNPNKPKSAWWVYKLYGNGVEKRVKSYNEEGRSVVLASKPSLPSIPYAQVLFGYVKRHEDDPAAKYLPNSGIYKIRLNNLSSVSTSAYYKITVNKIPYNDELNSQGNVIRTDNVELTSPEFVSEYYFEKDNIGGITYDFLAEKENLYQMVIQNVSINEYINETQFKRSVSKNISDELIIYPNPTNNFIVVSKGKSIETFEYKIIDLTGKIINTGSSIYNKEINIRNLAKGHYVFRIQQQTGLIINKKLIKN